MSNKVKIAFIIGTGRCGTSLLGQMLNSHSAICVPPELQLIFEYDGNGNRLFEEFIFCGPEGIDADKLSSIVKHCCPHKLELFYDYNAYCHRDETPKKSFAGFITDFYESIAKFHGKSWLIEQTPWYGQRLDILTSLFPDAKFIHMIRDGRDVALSYARTPWWYRSVHLNLDRWQKELKKISVDASLYLKSSSYLEVKYENLIANTEFELRRIFDFIGEDFQAVNIDPKQFIDYDKYMRLDVNQITSKEYGEWKKNKTTAVFTENVKAWQRNIEFFSDNLPTEISDWLCRYGYDVLDNERTHGTLHCSVREYSIKKYIQSLENNNSTREQHVAGLQKTIADQANHIHGLKKTISDQANHIQNIEHHVAGMQKTLEDQANHINNVESELVKYKSSLYGRLKSAGQRLCQLITSG